MSKKKLLSEAQVKRFMGLAGLNPINEMNYYKKDDAMHEEEDEEAMGEMPPAVDDEPAGEPSGEPEMEGGDADIEMDEQDLADVAEALNVLQDKLAPLLDQGEEAEEEPAEEPEMEEEPAEEPAEEEEEMDMMEAELMEVDMEMNEEEVVNEVARRVAKRIVEAKRAHRKMNEALGRKK